MPMSKDELFDIFREYATNEFADIPSSDNEVYYDFSEEFENKMLQLFKNLHSDKKSEKSNSIGRRKIIAILIAAIFVLSVGAMSVSAIREPIIEFIFKVYDGFTDVLIEGDTTDKLSYLYSVSQIPEGFVETEKLSNESINFVVYENKQNGNRFQISQRPTEDISGSVDNEHGHIETFDINGNKVNIYVNDSEDYYHAFWSIGSDYLTLSYFGTSTIDEIICLIKFIN